MLSTSSRRRAYAAGVLVLVLGAPTALAPSALAGPIRAKFDYAFTATQQQEWSYNNMLGPSDCAVAPAAGGGTQKSTFSAKGAGVDVTTDLARNRKKASFLITDTGTGAYERQGGFFIQRSARGACAEPDVTLGTQGCGSDGEKLFLKVNLQLDGTLDVGGSGGASNQPFSDASGITCPFMFFLNDASSFESVRNDEELSNDMSSGLLGSTKKISGAQFFKRKKIVLRGSRTRTYTPSGSSIPAGFNAKCTIDWTLTLTPAKRRR